MINNFHITNFKLTTIFAIDIGDLSNDASFYNQRRGLQSTLDEVKMLLGDSEIYDPITIESSEYAKTDKKERNTFSEFYSNKFMPLNINFKGSEPITGKYFSTSINSVKVGYHGSVSICCTTTFKKWTRKSKISISDFINEYNIFIETIRAELCSELKKFFEFWNSRIKFIQLNLIDTKLSNFQKFEILDFDHNLELPINTIFTNDKENAKQLARLLRMTKSSYSSFDDKKVEKLKELNLGSRNDELWIINEDRLVRHHPEDNIYLKAFLSDIILGIEILTQYESNLLYLNHWVVDKRAELRNILSEQKDKKQLENTLSEIWLDAIHIYDNTLEQYTRQRNIHHSFYNKVIKEGIKYQRLDEYSKQVKNEFKELFDTLNSISELQSTQTFLDLEKTNLKINSRMWVLSLILLLTAIFQLTPIVISLMNKRKVSSPQVEEKRKLKKENNLPVDEKKVLEIDSIKVTLLIK